MRTILFVGGGSVGHIAPSVAVWRELERDRTHRAVFICADREDDKAFLAAENLTHSPIVTPKFHPLKLGGLWRAIKEGKRLIERHDPEVVFSKGGYVSVPVCLAAAAKGIPIVLHESDVVGGRANALISLKAERVCKGFPTKESEKIAYTGNPVRPEITQGSKKRGYEITGFSGDRPVLMVTGGSQGAQALNDVVTALGETLLERFDVVHITGRGKAGMETMDKHYRQWEFVTHELPDLYAIADVGLARAGAGSIAELAANAIPSVLSPLRNVPHAHQERNAKMAEEHGGFVMRYQEDLTDTLMQDLVKLCTTSEREAALRLHKSDAAREIADVVRNILARSHTNA